jgi:hypothetical protein
MGGSVAYMLGPLHRLETFKLLNVVGIVYGLLGVIVLSEFIVQKEKWTRFVVETLSGVLIWAHLAIPLGAAGTSFALYFADSSKFPSSLVIGEASIIFLIYSLIPTFIVEDVVFRPKLKISKDPLIRVRRFGLFLVMAGMAVQLLAAIQDLMTS